MSEVPGNIVIIGGGIIGVSTAYYLSRHPSLPSTTRVTLIEGTDIAAGASGYAGGFLARDSDWHLPETEELSRFSYDLHRSLAEEYDGATKWGYRALDTYNITVDPSQPPVPSPVAWINQATEVTRRGNTSGTAQCMPNPFTKHLCSMFLTKPNSTLIVARAVSLERKEDGRPSSVGIEVQVEGRMETQSIPCDEVLLAAGPWMGKLVPTLLGEELRKKLEITSSQANSIIIRPQHPLSAHAIFARISMGGKEDENEPEVYCRPDGTTYFCGTAGPEPLPDTADKIPFSRVGIDKLKSEARALSPIFREENGAELVREGACYLPNTSSGRPIIGKVQPGIWFGGGHGVWGITQGPGTGYVLAEMIIGQNPSVNVSALSP